MICSWSLIYLWNLSIFLTYSVSKICSTSIYFSYFFLHYGVVFSSFWSPIISSAASFFFSFSIFFTMRFIGKQFDMSYILSIHFPSKAPITTEAELLSNSFFCECSNKLGRIDGYMIQCHCLATLIPKFRFASILF